MSKAVIDYEKLGKDEVMTITVCKDKEIAVAISKKRKKPASKTKAKKAKKRKKAPKRKAPKRAPKRKKPKKATKRKEPKKAPKRKEQKPSSSSNLNRAGAVEDALVCGICYCDIQHESHLSFAPCTHGPYHTKCLMKWSREKNQCPVCRRALYPNRGRAPARVPQPQRSSSIFEAFSDEIETIESLYNGFVTLSKFV